MSDVISWCWNSRWWKFYTSGLFEEFVLQSSLNVFSQKTRWRHEQEVWWHQHHDVVQRFKELIRNEKQSKVSRLSQTCFIRVYSSFVLIVERDRRVRGGGRHAAKSDGSGCDPAPTHGHPLHYWASLSGSLNGGRLLHRCISSWSTEGSWEGLIWTWTGNWSSKNNINVIHAESQIADMSWCHTKKGLKCFRWFTTLICQTRIKHISQGWARVIFS